MLDPLLRDAQDNLTRAANRFGRFAADPEALRRLAHIPNDELAGLIETLKQAQVGLSLISSALEQLAEKRGLGPGAAQAGPGD